MKIVKTQSRWKLHQHGFPVALRFDSYNECMKSKVESWCKDNLGYQEWMWNPRHSDNRMWATHWGSANGRDSTRPYFVAFRDASTITTLVLSLGLEVEKYADIFD